MKSKYFSIGVSVALLIALAAGAQAPTQSSVNHGVTLKYEQADPFPVHESHTIQVGNGAPYYDPPELTVFVGDVVKWTNKQLSDTHTIIDEHGHFESSPVPANKNWCYHFVQEGDYEYGCRFHPWMKGIVHVQRRQLPLTPLNPLQNAAVAIKPAKAVEDGRGGYWLAGLRPGSLIYRPAQGKGETITVARSTDLIVPLAATPSQLMAISGRSLKILDVATKKVSDTIVLQKGFLPIHAAALSDAEFWMTNVEGTTLGLVNMTRKTVRLRSLPAGSRVVSVRERRSRVWALDAGRQLLLSLGSEWINETPLPHDARNASSLVIDADGQPWFLDSANGLAGVLLNSGIIQSFSLSKTPGAQLMTLAGVEGIIFHDQRGGMKINFAAGDLATNLPAECNGTPVVADTNQSQSSEARHDVRH
jgi:plastocyanin